MVCCFLLLCLSIWIPYQKTLDHVCERNLRDYQCMWGFVVVVLSVTFGAIFSFKSVVCYGQYVTRYWRIYKYFACTQNINAIWVDFIRYLEWSFYLYRKFAIPFWHRGRWPIKREKMVCCFLLLCLSIWIPYQKTLDHVCERNLRDYQCMWGFVVVVLSVTFGAIFSFKSVVCYGQYVTRYWRIYKYFACTQNINAIWATQHYFNFVKFWFKISYI